MGQDLGVGIPTKITIRRKDITSEKADLACIKRGLEDVLDIGSYDFTQDSDQYYLWKIKPELLNANFKEFYAELMQDYDKKLTKQEIELISKSDAIGQELLDIAHNDGLFNFYTTDGVDEIIHLHDIEGNEINNGYNNSLDINLEFLVFCSEGKIMMECYGQLFSFFEQNLRKQYVQYPASKCLKILIFG